MRMSTALSEVELTPQQPDGSIRFGDVLQIHSAISQSAVACDLHDKASNTTPLYWQRHSWRVVGSSAPQGHDGSGLPAGELLRV